MIFKSYINNRFTNNKRNSQTSIYNLSEHKNKFSLAFLQNKHPIKLLSSSTFKIYKPFQKNYINYTMIKNNRENNYKYNTTKENDTMKKNSRTFKTINDHSKNFPKNNYSNSSSTLFKDKIYTNKRNYEKNNTNRIALKKFNKLIYDIKQDKKLESRINENNIKESYRNNIYKMSKFEKINFMKKLNRNLGVPINKRIKLLKEAKYSINQLQKNSLNSISSYDSLYRQNTHENNFNFSMIKTRELHMIKPYNDLSNISNKKPIIYKLLQKPKLNVPKFENINLIK